MGQISKPWPLNRCQLDFDIIRIGSMSLRHGCPRILESVLQLCAMVSKDTLNSMQTYVLQYELPCNSSIPFVCLTCVCPLCLSKFISPFSKFPFDFISSLHVSFSTAPSIIFYGSRVVFSHVIMVTECV